jgi:hypothetical protein
VITIKYIDHNSHGNCYPYTLPQHPWDIFKKSFHPSRPIHGGENRYYFKAHPFISLYFIKISFVCVVEVITWLLGRAKGAAIVIVASAVRFY